MESNGEPGKIHISGATASILQNDPSCKFIVAERGEIQIKGKGAMTTYWIDGATEDNVVCNEAAVHSIQSTLQRMLNRDKNANVHNIVPIQRGGSTREMARMMSTRNTYFPNGSPNRSPSNFGTLPNERFGDSAPALSVHKRVDSDVDGDNGNSFRVSYFGGMLLDFSGSKNRVRAANDDDNDLESSLYQNSAENSRIGKKPLYLEEFKSMRRSMRQADDVSDVQSLRLLHVDEESECVRSEASFIAINTTWSVDKASTGEMALKKCKACKFLYDVIFVADFSAEESELQGHEVVALIRAQESKEKILKCCIIVGICSSCAPSQTSKALLAAGADEIWYKPLPETSVLKVVMLDLWKTRRSGNDRKILTWAGETKQATP